MYRAVTAIAVSGGLILFVAARGDAEHTVPAAGRIAPQQWEYATRARQGSAIDASLNRMGSDGWELVAVERDELLFKRPAK